MKIHLDMSVGPVQGFVAQSRRTRDLWGSSYLLSFLTAHAVCGARGAGGKIIRPMVDEDELFLWVSGKRTGDAPTIGSVPNHFIVEVDGDATAVAAAATEALLGAWDRVQEAVWQHFVMHAASAGEGTKEIWDRQVHSFWEIVWTAGPADGGGLLARRKHWRSHWLPAEPGDKCTVMPDLQELSGYVRAQAQSDRENQDFFWDLVRDQVDSLDLRDNERLCAIALIKRLYPKVAAEAIGWDVDTVYWPSTTYVAAVPWIRRVSSVAPEAARTYADTLRKCAPSSVERRAPFRDLVVPQAGTFANLDASYYSRQFVSDEKLCRLEDDAGEEARRKLTGMLDELYKLGEEPDKPLGPPPSFYALLLADGDLMGQLVGRLGGESVGRALSSFTPKAPETVREFDGVTVYAGGDDVLAMLPVPNALPCARQLAREYAAAFDDVAAGADVTLSAAVIFAHAQLPLGPVIREAHRLLDDVAKDGNGRNSLAVEVLKRGGPHCQWVSTWTRQGPEGESSDAVGLLQRLVEQQGLKASDVGLSSALLYRIREMLAQLCEWPQWSPGSWGSLPPEMNLQPLVKAEILRTLAGSAGAAMQQDAMTQQDADELADLISELLAPSPNATVAAHAQRDAPRNEAGVDALLLARFIASGGQEEGL